MIFICLALLSCLPFLSSASNAMRQSRHSTSIVMNNSEFIRLVVELCIGDLAVRKISKSFLKCHDEVCSYHMGKLEPRLRHITTDENGQKVASQLCPTLPIEIPIFYLFSNHFKGFLQLFGDGLNESYPILQEGTVEDQRNIDKSRLITLLRVCNEAFFKPRDQGQFYAKVAFQIYRMAKLVFSTFGPDYDQILKTIALPQSEMLKKAAQGLFPDPYNGEILLVFDKLLVTYSELLKLSFEANRLDLVRTILNDPNVHFRHTYSLFQTFNIAQPPAHVPTLDFAARYGAIDLIDRCIQLGANPSQSDMNGVRPIHYAALNGNWDATMFLFLHDQQGITLNTTYFKAPIILAAEQGRFDIVSYVLNHPSVSLQGNHVVNQELIDITIQTSNPSLAKILVDCGKLYIAENYLEQILLLDFQNFE